MHRDLCNKFELHSHRANKLQKQRRLPNIVLIKKLS
jgi:hypothetical protein